MEDTFTIIGKEKLIAILRGLTQEQALCTVEALRAGGIRLMEITFDQTAPIENTTKAIAAAHAAFPDLVLGAGTVMTVQQVEAAYAAGASFIISPNADPEVIRATKKLGMLSMPGAMTPTEISVCHAAGADIVKIFPADSLGLPYLNAIKGPLHYIPLSAVGGVNLCNIQAFLAGGAYCVGLGGNIVNMSAIRQNNYAAITQLAKEYVAKIHGAAGERKNA